MEGFIVGWEQKGALWPMQSLAVPGGEGADPVMRAYRATITRPDSLSVLTSTYFRWLCIQRGRDP